ncbi:calpain-like cysteine peptidase [Trypanosoma theileri]|uniref:Calpain-like cysteine peptidase n=1 Tax=Trypanosoma theileri TaxID=67003 RepID=A0A1X0NUL2_9TRYP|nr:calpain-like cysteine peptidase [Trypanosoma theileri]ORC88397.1 calpain-like cysteine peptidase [Trypanosoma theileri]
MPAYSFALGNGTSGLPIWDEVQVMQENWGGNMGLPARKMNAVVELRGSEGKIVVKTNENDHNAFRECITSFYRTVKGGPSTEIAVNWKRPVDITSPFRPMVHRNTTPFLSPYDKERKIFQSTVTETVKQTPAPSGKKGDVKSVEQPVPIHIQFPEVVTVLDPLTLQNGTNEWESISDKDAIERYRELQPLMQPYDRGLQYGCAATPVEACGLEYSTEQRHKLKEIDNIAELPDVPPFVMDAFNSAIRFIEHAQSSIKEKEYLWELVYPHAPGTCHPVYNPYGKYVVRLFIDGAFRQVMIDDYMPVDALGRSFLTFTSQKEIWPALLAKAIFMALGTNRHLLFTDPETIVSCLKGEWVPQHINPRIQPAMACALTLAYRKELLNSDTLTTHFSASYTGGNTIIGEQEPSLGKQQDSNSLEKSVEVATTSVTAGGGTAVGGGTAGGSSGGGGGGGSGTSALPSCNNSPSEGGLLDNLYNSPHIISAVGTFEDGRRKLFVIREIVLFRDTLALQISTDPPSDIIEPKLLIADNEDELVQELLQFSSYVELGTNHCTKAVSNQSYIWVTFEELSEKLDLVVWQQLGEESPFRFVNRIIGLDDTVTAAGHSKKKGTTSVPSGALRRDTVRWIHINSEKTEQLALVSLGNFSVSPLNASSGTIAAAAAVTEKTSKKNRPPSVSSESRPILAQSANPSVDYKLPQEEIKEVRFDLYTWDRGDTWSYAGNFQYESGKLQCLIHTFPPGSHILRVTAVGLESQQCIGFLSTKEFVMGEEKDVFRSSNIFKITDAGAFMGVDRFNEEVIWFKRLFTVKEPTTISFVVSTLDASEDPATHRDIPPALIKEPRGAKVRVTSTKTVQKEPTEEVSRRSLDIPIIPFCYVLLMDLDNGTIRSGAIGRLVRQYLEPNQHGYLVMAYALIDKPSAEAITGGNPINLVSETSPLQLCESVASSTNEDKDNSSARDKPLQLSGKGNWKLAISTDRMFDSYRQMPQNVISFAEKGHLKRGSRALLFSYTCTIVEKTSFTLLLDLDAHDPIPFCIKVFRSGVEAPPVFVSDTCTKHLFLPHVTLEIGEKMKNISYNIEAWLDATKVQEWEERRRLAQETKFREIRQEAEQKAYERQEQDIKDYQTDPSNFIERLEQHAAAQLELIAASSMKEIPVAAVKKTRSNVERRKNVSGAGTAADKVGSSHSLIASPVTPAKLFLDTTDESLVITFDLRLQFSAKVDVKNGAPPKDPLATLRAMWVPPIEPGTHDHSSPHAPRAGTLKGKQRETTPTTEDLLRADQGRLSRQRFLDNPRDILIPYLTTSHEEGGATTRVVTDVAQEINYHHAPILPASQYRRRLLPLRAAEVRPPSSPTPPPTATRDASRAKSPALRLGAVSPNAASPLPAEDDADVAEVRAPVQEFLNRLTDDLRQAHERRNGGRETIREALRHYWSGRQQDPALLSLLGPREEDNGRRRKSRLRVTN